MDTFEPNPPIPPTNLAKNNNIAAYKKIAATTVVLAVVFGILGGIFGSYIFFRTDTGKKYLQSRAGTEVSQTIVLTEESAITSVVKKASGAVVSIVISKDLSKIPGYGTSPFSQDPFFNFFYGSSSQQNQNQSPNIQEIGAGSGFFVSGDGLILTNKHVVSDDQASYTVLTQDGKKYDAKVLAKDPVGDLALVKVDIQNAPFLILADSGKLEIGQRVIAIGNSLGQYQNTVTSGIVSGIGRQITAGGAGGSEELSGVIQTDAAINPGNSGGPLLNTTAEVIGINTAIDQQGQLVGFAIPANDAAKDLASFRKNGKITRPFLGIRYVPVTPALAQQQKLPRDYGALIVRGNSQTELAVLPGSPADKAGLVENDIILEIGGQKIDPTHNLGDLLKNYNPADSVAFKIYHQGAEKIVNVILGENK